MDLTLLKEANPWWENESWEKKDFHLANLLKQKIVWNYEIIKKFDEGIFSLRGPRQVGKTSWIKQQIKRIIENKTSAKNVCFYSCDNISKEDLSELLYSFLELALEGRKYIFLDEIPFVEGWEFVIKHLYDSGKLKDCFVLLCGSSSIDIKRSIERLPGRGDSAKRHFTMFPLMFEEYAKALGLSFKLGFGRKKDEINLKMHIKEVLSLYEDYLLTGGFLKIINEYKETGAISDASYDVYLKWIIGDIAKMSLKEKYAKQILRRVIETYSSEMSWSALLKGTDMDSHNTASKYAEALEETFVLNIIFKMDFNKKIPDYPKSKKIYFSDPFIFSAVYKWVNSVEGNFPRFKEYLKNNKDKISEGILLNHFIRTLTYNKSLDVFNYNDLIFYWANKSKTKEVDFVYQDRAFEVKYQNEINAQDYNGLEYFKEGYLISKDTFDKRTLPIGAFLLILNGWNILLHQLKNAKAGGNSKQT